MELYRQKMGHTRHAYYERDTAAENGIWALRHLVKNLRGQAMSEETMGALEIAEAALSALDKE
jgi:hypothetical protein